MFYAWNLDIIRSFYKKCWNTDTIRAVIKEKSRAVSAQLIFGAYIKNSCFKYARTDVNIAILTPVFLISVI